MGLYKKDSKISKSRYLQLEDLKQQTRLWKISTIHYLISYLSRISQASRTNSFNLKYYNLLNPNNKSELSKHLGQKTILVAEDDESNFIIIKAYLKRKNFIIIHAKNGAEAVDMFQSKKDISLILMDIQMPVMDGITATKKIRQIDKSIPVIVQTAFALESVRKKAMEAGCSDFITKPLKPEILTGKINQYIH